MDRALAIQGCILGTAVGDSLGLPLEGLSPARIEKLFGPSISQRFFLGHGMVSDDTDHACLVAEALITAHGDPEQFTLALSRALKRWLLTAPAGIGYATLRSTVKLLAGVSPAKSGVWSAGNGPAMRSALLGVVYGGDTGKLRDFVKRSTRITHSDPKAYLGALAVAVAAHISASVPAPVNADRFLEALFSAAGTDATPEFKALMESAARSAERSQKVRAFASALGSARGISGYIYHTVPCVIQVWLRSQGQFRQGLSEILPAGGDADTAGAILGAILGAGTGPDGIPVEWLSRIWEWPRTISYLKELSDNLDRCLSGEVIAQHPPPYTFLLARNLIFLLVVLGHVVRRRLPPY